MDEAAAGAALIDPLSSTRHGRDMTTVRQGSTGEDVKTLQSALRARGFFEPPLVIDGVFGDSTTAAVQAFQRSANLTVDGVCGDKTWTAVLRPDDARSLRMPASTTTPLPVFPSAVAQWGSWLMKSQDSRDPFPIDRALRFIALESGGNPCATGRIDTKTGHVYEAGLAQTYFETPTTRVHGVTSAELRALCACEGLTQKGGACTDQAKAIHADVALKDMMSHRARARVKLAGAGVTWAEDTFDFWAAVKAVHALPGLYSYLRPSGAESFTAWRDWVLSKTKEQTVNGRTTLVASAELQKIDRGTAAYADAFARCFENCERFAAP